MESSDLKTHAKEIDLKLNRAKFQTLVHGDAKLANFCFSKSDLDEGAPDCGCRFSVCWSRMRDERCGVLSGKLFRK
jgi:hypothetical protein